MTKKHPQETRVAGLGADGNLYGVTSMVSESDGKHRSARAKPCPSCPWRKDAEIGAFPAEAYRLSARTCYDAALSTFACHESGVDKPAVCAGFLLANSANNLGVRLGLSASRLDLDRIGNPDQVELYESYRDMAIANGVSEDDASIAPCRGDAESGWEVAERMQKYRQLTVKLPPRFIRDCLESECDIGSYDKGVLTATPSQLSELRDRAQHYAGPDSPDACDPVLKRAAGALLKAMKRDGLV